MDDLNLSTPRDRNGVSLANQSEADFQGPSRRSFLGGVAVAGASALLSSRPSNAQTGATANPRRIDFHHHYQAPDLMGLARSKGLNPPPPVWTLAKALEDMDKGGTATTLLSGIEIPAGLEGDVETVRKTIRITNDYGAKLRSEYPGRFGVLALIPLALNDIDGCMREIDYAVGTLKADGFAVMTSYGDRYVGDAVWMPIYEELNRRKAIVFVHPHSASCCSSIAKPAPQTVVEYGADTTRVIANLLFSGVAHKFPDIVWVFAHGGGMMPYVIERFLNATTEEIVPGVITKGQGGKGVVGDNPRKDVMPNGVLYELRRMYYDTAQCSNPVAMGALRKVVPVSQIVFGTDFHWRTAEETGRGLITSKIFNEAELHAINRGNVERLLPRYRT
jgi:predicted TIM-barrel fold metal-dependent hydrolase